MNYVDPKQKSEKGQIWGILITKKQENDEEKG